MIEVQDGVLAANFAFDVINRSGVDAEVGKQLDSISCVEFKNVSFFYPSKPQESVLKDFSEILDFSKSTALVGPRGSGKTTLVKLLMRCYECADGQILVDG